MGRIFPLQLPAINCILTCSDAGVEVMPLNNLPELIVPHLSCD